MGKVEELVQGSLIIQKSFIVSPGLLHSAY